MGAMSQAGFGQGSMSLDVFNAVSLFKVLIADRFFSLFINGMLGHDLGIIRWSPSNIRQGG